MPRQHLLLHHNHIGRRGGLDWAPLSLLPGITSSYIFVTKVGEEEIST
jgi:hypothetical protein